MRRGIHIFRSMVIVLLVVVSAVSLHSQAVVQSLGEPKCTLTLNRSPAIRGIKLGMDTGQVLAAVPGSSEKPEIKRELSAAEGAPRYGVARLYFQPITYPSPAREKFAGIDSVSVTLFDGRVMEIRVEYSGANSHPRGPLWVSVDDFVAKLSEAFDLPDAKDWGRSSSDERAMSCSDFGIEASASRRVGQVVLRNNRTYIDKVKERAAADEERLRREFKP